MFGELNLKVEINKTVTTKEVVDFLQSYELKLHTSTIGMDTLHGLTIEDYKKQTGSNDLESGYDIWLESDDIYILDIIASDGSVYVNLDNGKLPLHIVEKMIADDIMLHFSNGEISLYNL